MATIWLAGKRFGRQIKEGKNMRKFLHVGCGPHTKQQTGAFQSDDWQEVRLDIDPAVNPDIVASMTDLSLVPSASFDAVFSSHNIEHLHFHEVAGALREFRRVLKDTGFLVIACPDLQSICALVAQGQLLEPAYESSVGPISPMDVMYGYGKAMAAGNLFMAHKCGFTERVLSDELRNCGFASVASIQLTGAFELRAIATATPATENVLRELAATYLGIASA